MTFRQFLCGLRLHGHDRALRFENRAFPLPPVVRLHCRDCEHDTPGWVPEARGPVQKFAGDPRRHQITARSFLRIAKRKDVA